MKKFSKFMMIICCLFLLCGCNVYIYNFDKDNTNNNGNSENLTDSGTGTTIIESNTNYQGFINYTDKAPDTHTSWSIIYDKVISSVVTVRNIANGQISATGSGVIFAEDSMTNGYAYLFTNAHVVEGSSEIEILLYNGILVKGSLIGYDRNEDVAVVKIAKRSDYSIATLRRSSTLKIGEEILTVGSPLGEKYSETATSGIISNLNIGITPDNSSVDLYLIQIDAALNPGNSGGPLFDNNGNLIGINTMKLLKSGTTTNVESFNYAIPISHFELVSSYLLKGSLYYRPFLSITIIDIRYLSTSDREKYSLQVSNGLLLLTIDAKSPLNGKANKNQVITHIEGVKINKATDFSVELLKHAPDDTITLTICNTDGTNSHNIEITLIKR